MHEFLGYVAITIVCVGTGLAVLLFIAFLVHTIRYYRCPTIFRSGKLVSIHGKSTTIWDFGELGLATTDDEVIFRYARKGKTAEFGIRLFEGTIHIVGMASTPRSKSMKAGYL